MGCGASSEEDQQNLLGADSNPQNSDNGEAVGGFFTANNGASGQGKQQGPVTAPVQRLGNQSIREERKTEAVSDNNDSNNNNTDKPRVVKTVSEAQAKALYVAHHVGGDPPAGFKTADCSRRFPGTMVVGVKHWQAGLLEAGVVFDGVYHAEMLAAAPQILAQNKAWNKADGTSQTFAALDFVKDVLHAFHLVLDESETEVKRSMPQFGASYHRPQKVLERNGAVVVTCWVRHREGEEDSNTFRRYKYTFSNQGTTPAKRTELSKKTVPIKDRNLIKTAYG